MAIVNPFLEKKTSLITFLSCCLFLTQMSHTKPYIRKKAVLIMYKVFLKYPESLRPAFPRLKEKLEDPDPGIRITQWPDSVHMKLQPQI